MGNHQHNEGPQGASTYRGNTARHSITQIDADDDSSDTDIEAGGAMLQSVARAHKSEHKVDMLQGGSSASSCTARQSHQHKAGSQAAATVRASGAAAVMPAAANPRRRPPQASAAASPPPEAPAAVRVVASPAESVRGKKRRRLKSYSTAEKNRATPLIRKLMEAADYNSNQTGGAVGFRRLFQEARALAPVD